MGNIGIKINGEWVDLMSAFVPCQLCNEPVQIRDLEDVPLFDTINSQLCNEPTEAHDIVAEIKFKDDQPIVGTWQCRKCKAVNG